MYDVVFVNSSPVVFIINVGLKKISLQASCETFANKRTNNSVAVMSILPVWSTGIVYRHYCSAVTVASLGWVTPGAASEGVTPLFFSENLATFFCSSLSLSLSLFIAFTRMSRHPLEGVTSHLFTCPTSFLHYSL